MTPENYPGEKFEPGKPTATVSASRDAGINEELIAKELKEQLEAKRGRWNPKKKDHEQFPDNDARLAALRVTIKIFGGYLTENETNGEVIYYLHALKPGLKDDRRIIHRVDPNVPPLARGAPAKPANGTVEVICATALRHVGVDEAFIAKKLKELLEAKQPRWNPKKKELELVRDNDARLAAIKEVVKIFGSYPSDEEGPVNIHMDWMTPKKYSEAGYELVMRVPGK